jgi:CheY-like chemotaxis protein
MRMLEKLGYRADIAANGREVLEAVGRQPYDLILMDVQMPEMDGVTATQQILAGYGAETRPCIIAMTANALAGDRERFLAAGMDDYLSKPVKLDELTAKLANLSPQTGNSPLCLAGSSSQPTFVLFLFIKASYLMISG